jgi:hypothetical protein
MLPVDSSDEDFTVSVTPFSGDPDLYVALYPITHPSTSVYNWSAMAYRGDAITVSHSDPKFCQCDYYIAVYAFTSCSYSIMAWYASIQNLQNGVPTNGMVQLHAWVYYRIRVSGGITDITFSLTPQNGDPDIYISTAGEPNSTSSMWRQTGQQSTSLIRIDGSDPNFCSDNCTYYIGVYGVSGSNYTLTAVTSEMTTQLLNGVPQTDTLVQGTWEYFSFDVPTAGVDVSIILTAITGDPDLYVSNHTDRPNTTNYDYTARAYGTDAISIEQSPATTWYIGVYAFFNTTFTLAAYMDDDSNRTMTLLVNGVPQSGVVNPGHYKYYDFYVNQDVAQVTFTLSRSVGNPDIYVRNDGQTPNNTFYQWSSTSNGNDVIYVSPASAAEYLIAVYGVTTSNYTIKAETDDVTTTLIDGVSFTQYLQQGQYKYFKFPVDRLDMDLTFTVTGLNGDPDLYVSDTDANPRPNSTNYTWRATSNREDSISIPHENLHLGNYYASVYAWSNCTFTLLATLARTPTLQDGIPQSGQVAFEASNFYVFNVGNDHTDITFTVTPLNGNAYLYVSTIGPPDRTNSSSYQWSSVDPNAGQTIIIHSNDAHWCDNCVYHLQVYGHQPTNYTVSATSSVMTEELQEGVPRSSWANAQQYKYYKFTLTYSMADMTILVTPMTGDPDLYVSTTSQVPSTNNYQWKAVAYGSDAINIDYTDPNYIQGTYYIAVYAYTNTTFTLVVTVTDLSNANTSNNYLVLVNGVPQLGFLPYSNETAYYWFSIGSDPVDVTFTVTPRYGDPDMYIRNDGLTPTTTFSQWSALSYGRDTITILSTDPHSCTNCRYTVMIYSWSHTLYSISGTTSGAIQRLESGVPVLIVLPQGTYGYYSVLVDHSTDPLIISATSLSGDPDIYVAMNTTHPNSTNYQWRAYRYGSDQIVINNPQQGTYYISCYAFTNASFILLATNGPITLVNGEPHEDTLDVAQMRTYVLNVQNPENKDLFFTVNPNLGTPVMYISTDLFMNSSYPDPSHYLWTTASASVDTQRYALTVSMSQPGACNNCSYLISVMCPGTSGTSGSYCQYSITADYADSLILLSDGKPYSASVTQGASKYFRAVIDTVTDINIASTTFDGDVEIFVSVSNPYPSQSNFDWSSGTSNTRGDHVAISHTDPKFAVGPYYIAVYGIQDARYTITLATGLNLLTPGLPQLAALNSTGSASFFFNVNNIPTNISFSIFATNATSCDIPWVVKYNVYISSDEDNTAPGPDAYTWMTSLNEGGVFQIASNDPHYCDECTYYITVTGTPNQEFLVEASTQDTADTLLSSRCVAGTIVQGGWKYYQVFVTDAVNFVVLVESCTGNADVYASQTNYEPTQTRYIWKSTETGKNDQIEAADNSFYNSDFYIGVYGHDAGTSYRITTWTSEKPPYGPTAGTTLMLPTPSFDSVQLYFAPAVNDQGTDEGITYTAYYAPQDSPAVMYSMCGLAHATTVTQGFVKGNPGLGNTFTIRGLQSEKYYKFNIVARDANGNTLIYDQVTGVLTLGKQSQSGVDVAVVLGVGIPLTIIVVIVIAYLIYRNRKLTAAMQFEDPEIPKKRVWGPRFVKLLKEAPEPEEEDDTDAPTDPSGGHSLS